MSGDGFPSDDAGDLSAVIPPLSRQRLKHWNDRATPGGPAVIGLTRIYCHNRNDFRLVDVDTPEAEEAADQLREDGWEVEAEIPV